ncbi:MAG: preprotein translocase subunit SecE [Eubacteriales bacterium]
MAEEKEKAVKAEKKSEKPAKKKKEKSHKISGYFRDLKSELKKITWYSAHDTLQNSVWVVAALIILTAVIGGVNWGFAQIMLLLGRLV